MKMCRGQQADNSLDLIKVSTHVAERYNKQRYTDPAKDHHDYYQILPSSQPDTRTVQFDHSSIIIIEKEVELAEMSLPAAMEQCRILESDLDKEISELKTSCKPLWSVFWLKLQENERKPAAALIRSWLRETLRPEDSELVIQGTTDVSMTWLRYVVVENEYTASTLDAMRIAQYYYAEFDQLNAQLFELMLRLSQGRAKLALSELSKMKTAAEVKGLKLQEDLKSLPRRKKQQVEQILTDWDFSRLQESVTDIRRVCADLIATKQEKKAGVSRVATEIILVAIGLFAFLDLAISWAIYSRQFATDPTLLIDEKTVPWIAQVFANTPMDVLVLATLGIMILIMVVYGLLKSWFR